MTYLEYKKNISFILGTYKWLAKVLFKYHFDLDYGGATVASDFGLKRTKMKNFTSILILAIFATTISCYPSEFSAISVIYRVKV